MYPHILSRVSSPVPARSDRAVRAVRELRLSSWSEIVERAGAGADTLRAGAALLCARQRVQRKAGDDGEEREEIKDEECTVPVPFSARTHSWVALTPAGCSFASASDAILSAPVAPKVCSPSPVV
jgi:hypothetical protein